MNTPIISPWLFYFADIATALRFVFIAAGILTLVISLIGLADAFDRNQKNDVKTCRKWIVVGAFAVVLGILCPSKETCYKMAFAKFATPQNIQTVTEYVDDTATTASDNVTEAIKDIMDYSVDRIYDIRNNQKASDNK